MRFRTGGSPRLGDVLPRPEHLSASITQTPPAVNSALISRALYMDLYCSVGSGGCKDLKGKFVGNMHRNRFDYI